MIDIHTGGLKIDMTLDQHSAPGSNAGFIYQFERALFWLAQSPAGFVIGIETDDDVAVRGTDGSQLLEQDKHSIQGNGKPFGNRSKDLWNTLAIWIEALDTGEVSVETTRFLMVTNKTLPDCIARNISIAGTEEQVTACIALLELEATTPPTHIAELMQRVLSPGSRANLKKLIEHCELVDASDGSTGIQLRKRTIARLQLPNWCSADSDSIADELLGWLHRTALNSWQQDIPAWIKRDSFVNQLHAVVDLRKRQIKRERAENLIPVTDDNIGQQKGSPFVKQIYLVTDDDSTVENAIREFIRCNIEKMRLSAEGNITDDDWIAFETTLKSRWAKIRSRVIRMSHGKAEEDVGFEIFTDATEDHREKLAGSDTDQVYLTSGTYHRLANMIQVGWHPRFEELMREIQEMS
jgi:hypothetical protein